MWTRQYWREAGRGGRFGGGGAAALSGLYWSATMRDHVAYETRLELARLLFADRDQTLRAIYAQPFLLTATVLGRLRRHAPGFRLVGADGGCRWLMSNRRRGWASRGSRTRLGGPLGGTSLVRWTR
jgi:hypothetical protein